MTPTNSGHGWVFRAPGGVKARCGGPGLCASCDADLALMASMKPDCGQTEAERELQQQMDRARAAT